MNKFKIPTSNFKRGIIYLIICTLFEVGGLTLGFSPTWAAGNIPSKNGAADFTLSDLSGHMVKLSDFRGKVIFLNFWATWCPPCRSEMPSIQKLDKLMAGEKFQLLAVSVDNSGSETVKKFMQDGKYSFKVLHDRTGGVSAKYGVRGIPATFIIDQTGAIVETAVGARDWATPEIVKRLKGLAQGKSWQ